jgi:hypothetical protein
VPAVAVTPAPKAYMKIAAVKKLVVEMRGVRDNAGQFLLAERWHPRGDTTGTSFTGRFGRFAKATLQKAECSKQ